MSNIPAFPIKDFPYQESHDGLSMRDYFAAQAMQGYCSDSEYKKECGQEDTAIAAYRMADAMMKAREA